MPWIKNSKQIAKAAFLFSADWIYFTFFLWAWTSTGMECCYCLWIYDCTLNLVGLNIYCILTVLSCFCYIWFRKHFLASIKFCNAYFFKEKGKFLYLWLQMISTWTRFSRKKGKVIVHLTNMLRTFCVPNIVPGTEGVKEYMSWLVPSRVAVGKIR